MNTKIMRSVRVCETCEWFRSYGEVPSDGSAAYLQCILSKSQMYFKLLVFETTAPPEGCPLGLEHRTVLTLREL